MRSNKRKRNRTNYVENNEKMVHVNLKDEIDIEEDGYVEENQKSDGEYDIDMLNNAGITTDIKGKIKQNKEKQREKEKFKQKQRKQTKRRKIQESEDEDYDPNKEESSIEEEEEEDDHNKDEEEEEYKDEDNDDEPSLLNIYQKQSNDINKRKVLKRNRDHSPKKAKKTNNHIPSKLPTFSPHVNVINDSLQNKLLISNPIIPLKPPQKDKEPKEDTLMVPKYNPIIKNEDDNENNKKEIFANPSLMLPSFLLPENIKDKDGRSPDDPLYDPCTLFIPKDYLNKQTAVMKQYWNFKCDRFDAIVLFKLGGFYEMFYDDAIIGNSLLGLNWMGTDPTKMHVAFHEKAFDSKTEILIRAGYSIACTEQMETNQQMKERLESSKGEDTMMIRKLCSVLTRGTYYNKTYDNVSYNNYKNKYCLTLIKGDDNMNIDWGIMLFDVTTLNFYIGRIIEESSNDTTASPSFSKLETLLYNINPEEIIIQRNNIPPSIINFIHTLSSKPTIITMKNDYSIKKLNEIVIKYFGESFELWNKVIMSTITNENNDKVSCVTLYITICHLERLLLASECLATSSFYYYNEHEIINPKKSLVLDYQTTINLEITETKINPKNIEEGSLVDFMNKAVTPFGKRLLKNWILNPLYDINTINERLDIIEDLMGNEELLDTLRTQLLKCSDFERQCAKYYKLAINTHEGAVYAQDIGKDRLYDFFKLIETLLKSMHLFEMVKRYINKMTFKSPKLKQMLIIANEDKEGVIPDLKIFLSEFTNNFTVKETYLNKNDPPNIQIESKPGISPGYDAVLNDLKNLDNKFNEILVKERKRMNCAIMNYSSNKGFIYELEMPIEYILRRPSDYIMTTASKSHSRYHTPEIQELVNQHKVMITQLKVEKNKLNVILFKAFLSKQNIITEYLKNVAELDCYGALAYVSIFGKQINHFSSRPIFFQINHNGNLPYLEMRDLRHPCLSNKVPYFVPNDVIIGDDHKTTIVITGPNMGGKSTLLRSVCSAIIMAQVGCYVPASKCIMTPVDRIFTRIGARDVLLEGKSTFYVEMEETKTILNHATINSMVIMDELGRGTSTHDGKIIAKTIIDRIEKGIGCRMLFTTHYHDIIDWCSQQKGIELFFMDCDVNLESRAISFKYKFTKGICPASYGISVAKLAGLPKSIIEMADKVSKANRLHQKDYLNSS